MKHLIETIERNAIDNKATITNVALWAEKWKRFYKHEQQDLLIDFFKHFRDNGEKNIGMTIEQFVDNFLKIKTVNNCPCGLDKRAAMDCTSKKCKFQGVL